MRIPTYFCDIDNFGDQLNREIFREVGGIDIEGVALNDAAIMGIGSILEDVLERDKRDTPGEVAGGALAIFGSGFGHDVGGFPHDTGIAVPEKIAREMKVYALRGKYTLERLQNILKRDLHSVPLGDPGLLANELVKHPVSKKEFEVGIVPHFAEEDDEVFKILAKNIPNAKVISVRLRPQEFMHQLSLCRTVISTALHPLIACDALGIPNLWARLSERVTTRYKFQDYYSVFGLTKSPLLIDRHNPPKLFADDIIKKYDISQEKVKRVQRGLKRGLKKMMSDQMEHEPLKRFVEHDIPDRSVLIVEPNPYHGEILPGFTKYFQDLGFHVDLLIRSELEAEDPFALVPKPLRPTIFYMAADQMKACLGMAKISQYDLVFFSSNVYWVLNECNSSYIRYLGHVPSGKNGSLFVEHNLWSLGADDAELLHENNRVFTLLKYQTDTSGKYSLMLNPHYFGVIPKVKVNKKLIKIAVVGSTNQQSSLRKELLQAIKGLKDSNIRFIYIGEEFEVPRSIRGSISFTGRLSFRDLYKQIAAVDYLLTLFNPLEPAQHQYLRGTTSGTVQLSLGFKKPLILERRYAEQYGFDADSAVVFDQVLTAELLKGIAPSTAEAYRELVNKLEERSRAIYEESVKNLRTVVTDMQRTPRGYTESIHRQTMSAIRREAEEQRLQGEIDSLQAIIKEQRDQIAELDRLVNSRRFRMASRLANSASSVLPPGSLLRRTILMPRYMIRNIRRPKPAENTSSAISLVYDDVSRSGYFDADYYLEHNEDVRESGLNAIDHYVQFGIYENRSPGPRFNCELFTIQDAEASTSDTPLFLLYLEGVERGLYTPDQFGVEREEDYEIAFDEDLHKDLNTSRPAILMPSISWNDPLRQRPHHIARLLAESNVIVVYVDKWVSVPRKIDDNLYLLPDNKKYKKMLLDFISDKKYYWVFSTSKVAFEELQRAVDAGYKIIYDYIDEIDEKISGDTTAQLDVFHNLERINPSLLIASAARLRKQLMKRFPKKDVLLVPNGVDLSHFRANLNKGPRDLPADLEVITKTGKSLVGYYGALAPWLDYNLINSMTKRNPDLQFVFIGPNYRDGLDNLIIRDNVHYLGPKPYEILADYSRWFDCAVIPFQEGEIAKTTSPVKLFEYMAMGIPTVCTRDLEECQGYDYVFMSGSEKEFEQNIRKAIAERHQPKTQGILTRQAKLNTWQARVQVIVKALMSNTRG